MKVRCSRQLAKLRIKCRSWDKGFMRIPKAVKQQLQRCFIYLSKNVEQLEDLKAGHFTVLTISNDENQKFLVALSYLRNPPFLKLLEAAEQEFGPNQPGVIAIPCDASELLRILSSNAS